MRIDEKKAAEFLLQNDEFIILTHQNPDGDTLGSAYALMGALKKLNKRARVINEGEIPKKFGFLVLPDDEVSCEAPVVAVDIADTKLMGALEEEYAGKTALCIDHHGTNTQYAQMTLVDSSAAANCEIMYRVIQKMGVLPDEAIATALFTGLSTDTGCFRYSNVTGNTHRCAGELIDFGAKHAQVNVSMFETKSPEYFALERLCLENMQILFGGTVALITLTQEMYRQSGGDESLSDAIAAIPRQVEGAKIGVTIREKQDGSFKVSLRTHEPYDAARICGMMGGGGHSRAAGCQIENADIEKATRLVTQCIEKVINEK